MLLDPEGPAVSLWLRPQPALCVSNGQPRAKHTEYQPEVFRPPKVSSSHSCHWPGSHSGKLIKVGLL